jgi:hypothetical protein
MIPFRRPEKLVVKQLNEGFQNDFWYDVAIPDYDEMHNEVYDIANEIFVEDVYRLANGSRGDVWVDAGGHVGLFSIAAMMAGAEIAAMIDMDGELAWCSRQNVISARLQLQRRAVLRDHGITPCIVAEQVVSSDLLVDVAMLVSESLRHQVRLCLKIDIQGAERGVLEDGGAAKLADAFDYMVMEWHHEDDPSWLLEGGGWSINAMHSHVDTLLNSPTRIVFATSG